MGKSQNKNCMKKNTAFKFWILYSSFLIFFGSCVTIQPVEVRNVDNFQLKDVLTTPNVQFDVNIHNPNNFGLTLKEFKSTAFLGDKMVTDIFIEKKIYIGANSDITIPLQTQPSLKDITGIVLSGNASGDLKVEGFIVVRKFIFRKKFPFSIKTKI
jgi:LEA14-like dessication related protein